MANKRFTTISQSIAAFITEQNKLFKTYRTPNPTVFFLLRGWQKADIVFFLVVYVYTTAWVHIVVYRELNMKCLHKMKFSSDAKKKMKRNSISRLF